MWLRYGATYGRLKPSSVSTRSGEMYLQRLALIVILFYLIFDVFISMPLLDAFTLSRRFAAIVFLVLRIGYCHFRLVKVVIFVFVRFSVVKT